MFSAHTNTSRVDHIIGQSNSGLETVSVTESWQSNAISKCVHVCAGVACVVVSTGVSSTAGRSRPIGKYLLDKYVCVTM